MNQIEVVAAVIHKEEQGETKIFATQRGYGEFKDGWEFPGGKMEPGEQRQQALIREIKEELATEVEVGDFLCTVEYDYPNFHLTMHCYWCGVVNGSLELLEHEDAKWLGKGEMDSVEWLAADLDVVDAVKKRIG